MKPGRTSCINPACRRTADAEKFPDEMICGKCFRALPPALREIHRDAWKSYRLYCRRINRTGDLLKLQTLKKIRDRHAFRIESNWQRIKECFLAPEKPEGLDNFLDEMGMQ